MVDNYIVMEMTPIGGNDPKKDVEDAMTKEEENIINAMLNAKSIGSVK